MTRPNPISTHRSEKSSSPLPGGTRDGSGQLTTRQSCTRSASSRPTEQLGHRHAKSAVNQNFYDFCQSIATSSGARVIEGEGGGIRAALAALRQSGMREPDFWDTGVTFTVRLPREGLISHEDLAWVHGLPQAEALTEIQVQVVASMRHGQEWTNQQLRDAFGPMDTTEARQLLQGLVYMGVAEAEGERGGRRYRLAHSEPPHVEPLEVHSVGPTYVEEYSPPNPATMRWEGTPVTKNEPLIRRALEQGGSLGKSALVEITGLAAPTVAYALTIMRDHGLVRIHGSQGSKNATYSLVNPANDGADDGDLHSGPRGSHDDCR